MVLKSSMGRYKLDVRYGDRNTLPYYNGALDGSLLALTTAANFAQAGKVYTLTTGGRLTPGLTSQGTLPFFGWSGLDANNYPDTQRDDGMPGFLDKPADYTTPDGAVIEGLGGPGSPGFPGIPSGSISGPVAGGFATIQHFAAAELATTAFAVDDSLNAYDALIGTVGVAKTDYTPGTALTALCYKDDAPTTTDKNESVGLLVPTQTSTDIVVGYVGAAGVYLGPEGYLVLSFNPTYVAGTTVNVLNSGALVTGNGTAAPVS